MIFLLGCVFVLMLAALFTFNLFGVTRGGAKASAPGCGLDFFFCDGDKKKRRLCKSLVTTSVQTAEMLSFLQETCCAIPLHAESVRVLSSPAQFYEELQRRVRGAQRSVVLSALYIGDGPLSAVFIACLEEKVIAATKSGQPFDICILLDYNRMHDRRNLFALKRLLKLASPSGGATALVQVQLFLFQMQSRLGRVLAPFGRAKEALGVQHTKVFCFDSKHTILSGANLSDDYFATRMDRYVVIEDNVHVAAWFSDLVHTLCCVSHPVVCQEKVESVCIKNINDNNINSTNYDTNNSNTNNNNNNNSYVSNNLRKRREKIKVHKGSDLIILPNVSGIDPGAESLAFSVYAKQLLADFAARVVAVTDKLLLEKEADTFLFPTLQWARAGVLHDSQVVQQLLHMAPASTHVYLTSPYLNMDADFVQEFIHSETTYDLITASVNTNGWCGAKGFAGYIPYFYLQLERAFYYLMREYGCSERVRVREFSVDGLTFHAKGLWFLNSDTVTNGHNDNNTSCDDGCRDVSGDEGNTTMNGPYLVAYGSTNYGYRSVHKDVEAEAFLFTTNASLREALREELCFLLRQSKLITEERFVNGAEGRFQPVASLLAQMGQAYL